MDRLLTKQDLSERWQLSCSAIDNYIREGIIIPVHGLKVVRFNPLYIQEIEGTIPEPITWIEKKLQKENELLREKISKLEKAIANIMGQCTNIEV